VWRDIQAEGNSVQGGVSITSLKDSSLRGEALKKTATGHEAGQSVARKRRAHSAKARDGPRYNGELAKGLREGQE